MLKQVADAETAEILKIAKECLAVEGDFVEMGCYEGDTSIILGEVLRGSDKKLWLYDSFEGLPKKTAEDESVAGAAFKEGVLAVTKRAVKLRFLRAGMPVPVIKKAWFCELVDADLPEKIAFAFLDGDLYESIKDSLRLVVGKMADGGAIIVHDYNNPELPGVSKAVDEWMKDRNGGSAGGNGGNGGDGAGGNGGNGGDGGNGGARWKLEQKESLAIIRF